MSLPSLSHVAIGRPHPTAADGASGLTGSKRVSCCVTDQRFAAFDHTEAALTPEARRTMAMKDSLSDPISVGFRCFATMLSM